MSVHYTSPIWRLDLPPTPKMILLKFGDNANDDGYAWPSLERVARETGYGLSTVREKVRVMRGDGVLVLKRGGKGGRAPNDEDGQRHGATARYYIDLGRAKDLYRRNGLGFGAGLKDGEEGSDPPDAGGLANPPDDGPNPPDDGPNPPDDRRASIEEPSSKPSSEPARAREAGGGTPDGQPPACAIWRDNLAALEALPAWPLLRRAIPDHDDGKTLTLAVEAPLVGFGILAWAAPAAGAALGRRLACRVEKWVEPALIERGVIRAGVANNVAHRRQGEPVGLGDAAWRLWCNHAEEIEALAAAPILVDCLPDDLDQNGLYLVTGGVKGAGALHEEAGAQAAKVLGVPIVPRIRFYLDVILAARAAAGQREGARESG